MTADRLTDGQWWRRQDEMVTVSYAQLRKAATALVEKLGAASDDAAFIVDTHLDKALQGDHERGLAMLCAQIQAGRNGKLDFAPTVRVLRDNGAVAVVAGEAATSPKLICRQAMALAIAKARQYGIGCVAARGRGEILTPFVQQAVEAGVIGMVMAQSIPLVAPHGGSSPLLGNAPVAWGIPVPGEAPIIVDMSLTQTSAKGVALAAAQGEAVPEGFLLDSAGKPTTDPKNFLDPAWLARGRQVAAGSLLPIGGSHKSYALIFIVGLLTAILPGADFPWELGNERDGKGDFGTLFIAIAPAAFGEADAILSRAAEYVRHLRGSPQRKGGGPVLYPGERSQELKRQRRERDEIELPAAHHRAFLALVAEV